MEKNIYRKFFKKSFQNNKNLKIILCEIYFLVL